MKEQSKSDERPFVMRQKHDFWSKIEAGANLNTLLRVTRVR